MRKYYDEISRIAGNVVTVKAGDVGYDELAVISSDRGESLAQVIRLEGHHVSLQVFAGTQGVSNSDRVRMLHAPMQVSFSDDLLGRVFDGSGKPRDGRAAVEGKRATLYSMQVPNPRPDVPIATIDVVRATDRATPALLSITLGEILTGS